MQQRPACRRQALYRCFRRHTADKIPTPQAPASISARPYFPLTLSPIKSISCQERVPKHCDRAARIEKGAQDEEETQKRRQETPQEAQVASADLYQGRGTYAPRSSYWADLCTATACVPHSRRRASLQRIPSFTLTRTRWRKAV